MRKAMEEKIRIAKEKGKGQRWSDWRDAPVCWASMVKYKDIFEVKIEHISFVDDGDEDCIEEWIEERKLWRFK